MNKQLLWIEVPTTRGECKHKAGQSFLATINQKPPLFPGSRHKTNANTTQTRRRHLFQEPKVETKYRLVQGFNTPPVLGLLGALQVWAHLMVKWTNPRLSSKCWACWRHKKPSEHWSFRWRVRVLKIAPFKVPEDLNWDWTNHPNSCPLQRFSHLKPSRKLQKQPSRIGS